MLSVAQFISSPGVTSEGGHVAQTGLVSAAKTGAVHITAPNAISMTAKNLSTFADIPGIVPQVYPPVKR
jgi:hypothetical protein